MPWYSVRTPRKTTTRLPTSPSRSRRSSGAGPGRRNSGSMPSASSTTRFRGTRQTSTSSRAKFPEEGRSRAGQRSTHRSSRRSDAGSGPRAARCPCAIISSATLPWRSATAGRPTSRPTTDAIAAPSWRCPCSTSGRKRRAARSVVPSSSPSRYGRWGENPTGSVRTHGTRGVRTVADLRMVASDRVGGHQGLDAEAAEDPDLLEDPDVASAVPEERRRGDHQHAHRRLIVAEGRARARRPRGAQRRDAPWRGGRRPAPRTTGGAAAARARPRECSRGPSTAAAGRGRLVLGARRRRELGREPQSAKIAARTRTRSTRRRW